MCVCGQATNYGTVTTSELEYHFVNSASGNELTMLFGRDEWPSETLLPSGDERRRRARPLQMYRDLMCEKNSQLRRLGEPPMIVEELMAITATTSH